MILVRYFLIALLCLSLPKISYGAAPACNQPSSSHQIQNLCKQLVQQCGDVPERKRITCDGNPFVETGYEFIGCLTGVYKSVKDLGSILFEVAKFVVMLPVHAIGAVPGAAVSLYDAAKDPNATINKARQLTRARVLSISQLQNYINREIAVTKQNMGTLGKVPVVSSAVATAEVAKKILGPVFATLGSKIEEFAEQQVHNFACYNNANKTEMLCRVAADFLIPPAGVFGILKGGGKELIKNFPNIARAIVGLTKTVAADRAVVSSAEVAASSERRLAAVTDSAKAASEPLGFDRAEYRKLDAAAFHTAEANLFKIVRGTPEVAAAANEKVLKDMAGFPQPPPVYGRSTGLSKSDINKLYNTVENNKVADICNITKYDPKGTVGFCFGRATAAHIEAIRAGLDKNQIRKIWAVGNFETESNKWRYHVTTVVRASDGEWYAVDPIMGQPVKLAEWYHEMQKMDVTHDMRLFSTRAERFGPSNPKYKPKIMQNSFYNGYFDDLMNTFKEPRN